MSDNSAYEGWAVVELMGHRSLGGLVSEVEAYGGRLMRVDVYDGEAEEPALTQYYGASAIYCVTPATEEMAREAGRRTLPQATVPALLSLPATYTVEDDWR